jgi:hypothetical protein
MSDMPERIWAWFFHAGKRNEDMQGGWDDKSSRREVEYIRADLVPAADPLADERVRALVEALQPFANAADEADEYGEYDESQAPVDCRQCRAARAAYQEATK